MADETEKRKPRPAKPAPARKRTRQFATGALPTREQVLEAMSENPDIDGKRDLAKFFGIKGDMRTPFKVLLKDMESEGFIARKRKALRRTATLPACDRWTFSKSARNSPSSGTTARRVS